MTYQIVTMPGFPGYYVDNEGFVWSEKVRGRPTSKPAQPKIRRLKRRLHYSGYLYVGLSNNKKENRRFIHRLVLEAFVGSCPKEMETRHLNGIKNDNRLDNLKWGTCKENRADRLLHGTDDRGEKSVLAKLTNQDAIEIYKLKGIETQKSLADRFGVSRGTIYGIWKKKTWKHILT